MQAIDDGFPTDDSVIEIVTAVVIDPAGRLLLVRKRGTDAFMQPGGKREPGEDDLTALARELQEEIGCTFAPAAAEPLGTFEACAANEPGMKVRAAIYAVAVTGDIVRQGEIAETRWIDPFAPGETALAPLIRETVLPLVRARSAHQAR